MSYEIDIVIDETALDVEWLDQSKRMGNYCKLAAEARRAMDLAEENLNFVRATLERAIRLKPEDYGVVVGVRGITEDAIKSAIRAIVVHGEYQIASRAYIDAKYEHEIAVGAVRAFDQRKSALENLVKLYGQQYFAGPSVSRDLSAERQRRDQSVQRSVRISAPPGTMVSSTSISGEISTTVRRRG